MHNKLKLMFRWTDLVYPIGITILIVFLCILGLIKGELLSSDSNSKIPMILSCSICGFVTLLLGIIFYIIRWNFIKKISFITNLGVAVIYKGLKNQPTKAQIEKWSHDINYLWGEKFLLGQKINSYFNKTIAIFYDDHIIKLNNRGTYRLVYGYADDKYIHIGAPDNWDDVDKAWKRTESLFKHELSHVILKKIDIKYRDENTSHEIMKRYGI